MASEEQNREAFAIQQFYCEAMAAPMYARLCAAIRIGLDRGTEVGRRILDWPGEPTRDALPLRFIGGLHALVQSGADDRLAAVFASETMDEEAIAATVNAVLADHEAALLPWLDGPPQTNEPGRSGALMLGLMEIARRHDPRIEILEIGSSAGLNLLIDRYRFDLGGVMIGPDDAPVTIRPEWRGASPEPVPVEIVSVRGSDIRPLDATDPEVERRLAAYVWAETPERLARVRGAIGMLRERGVELVRADAADWLERELATPQPKGTTRVVMHSVVWQYLPEAIAERIRAAMARAADRATPDRPLGWVMLEPDRATARQQVRVRSWPGHDTWQTIASAHAHGTWIDTRLDEQGIAIDLPDSAKVAAG